LQIAHSLQREVEQADCTPISNLIDFFQVRWLKKVAGDDEQLIVARSVLGWEPTSNSTKQSDIVYPYDKAKMRNYAPDFVSEAQYKKILAENGACNALHQASRLPEVAAMRNPLMEFAAGNEATLKRTLDSAQTEAARLAPDLDRLFETLKRGEKDRDKIRSARWKAGYDLAMGRVLAAKVRIEGYNAMLASLKRGRKFKEAGSMTWVLEPSASIDEAGGKYVTMAKKANEYLNRVVKEHEGTPWAELAKLELKSQIGWKWTER